MASNQDKGVDWYIIRRLLFGDFHPYRKRAMLAVVFMVITAVATAGATYIIKLIVDDIFIAQNPNLVLPIASAIMVTFLIKGLSNYLSLVILDRASNELTADLRKKGVRNLLALPVVYFDQVEISTIINRIVQVTKSAGDLVRTLLTIALRDSLTVIFMVILMFSQDWRLTLGVLFIGPVTIFSINALSRRLRSAVQGEFDHNGNFIQLLLERFQNTRLIKSYHVEIRAEQEFATTIDTIRDHSIRFGKLAAIRSPLMETLGGFAVAAMITYAGFAIIRGQATAGGLFLIITAFLTAYEPLKNLSRLRLEIVNSTLPLREYYALIDEDAVAEQSGEPFLATKGEISFEQVSFYYANSDLPVLSKVSFTAQAGQTTAIVGPSGAGKSTLFALLQGYYQPSEGRITIDDHNTSDMRRTDLRRTLAPIPQSTAIFTGSIADNIALGDMSPDNDKVARAASIAQMDNFVSKMPDGLASRIGDGEASLSGGQQQRLGIARAVFKGAPILLLDEATSALDSASEGAVQKAIKKASAGKTVLVIAHRLSTIHDADQIIVMDQGKVVDIGTHQELIARGGLYAELDALQSTPRN